MHLFKDIDYDLGLLRDATQLVDERLAKLDFRADASDDPDGDGTLDQIDYFTGFGFVACQVYISRHLAHAKAPPADALAQGPVHRCGVSVAALAYAAANMWKHRSEWPFDYASQTWRFGKLEERSRRTIETLEKLELDTRPGHYSAANTLYEIARPHPARFESLLPFLQRWRDELYP